jgi:hypothetical protein
MAPIKLRTFITVLLKLTTFDHRETMQQAVHWNPACGGGFRR